MAQKIDKFTKYRALICAMAVNFMIGSYYMYSNMYIYVSHYLRNQPGNDMDKEGKKAQLIMPIWLMVQSCVSVLSVKIGEKIGFKTLNYIAFVWFTLNNLAMIYVKDYYVYVAVYGVSNGIAIGCGYLPAMYTAWTYFPDRKSVATGVILFCAGMSASISSPIVTRIVNPNNVDPSEKEVYERVPYLFQCLTIAYGSITLLACTFQPAPFQSSNAIEKKELKRKLTLAKTSEDRQNIQGRIRGLSIAGQGLAHHLTEKDVERVTKELFLRDIGPKTGMEALVMNQLDPEALEDLVTVQTTDGRKTFKVKTEILNLDHLEASLADDLQDGARMTGEQIYEFSKELELTECPSFGAGFFSVSFLMMALMAFCTAIFNYFFLVAWKGIFKTNLSFSDSGLANLLIIGAAANSSFRILVGILMMKLSFKQLYVTMVLTIMFLSFTCDSLVLKPQNQVLGMVYLFFSFGCLGTMITIFPTTCIQVFGSQVGPKLYPCIFVCFSLASLGAYTILRIFSDPVVMFYMLGGIATFGFLLSIFFNPHPTWKKAVEASD